MSAVSLCSSRLLEKTISRKDAKAQRKPEKKQGGFLVGFLCAFASLREYRNSLNQKSGQNHHWRDPHGADPDIRTPG